MTGLLLVPGRRLRAVLLPVLGIAEAAALATGAFATRDAFAALHATGSLQPGTLVLLALAGIGAATAQLLARRLGEALGQDIGRDLRARVFGHLAGMDHSALAARRVGGLSLRFVGDLSAARLWFGLGLPRALAGAIVLPAALAVLWMLDGRLALAAGVPLGLGAILAVAVARRLRARQAALRRQRSALSAAALERIAQAPAIDLIGRTDRELRDLDAGGAALAAGAVARAGQVALMRLFLQSGAAAAAAAVLWLTAAQGLAPGLAAAALALLGLLATPLADLADAWDRFCAWDAARDRMQALFALPSERRSSAARGRPVALSLRLAGGIAAAVAPGALLVITGPAGSGKSRLARQIVGLDRAGADTQILYDGATGPLPHVRHLGEVPLVLQGSLRRALTLGIIPRPSDRRIAARARDFGLGTLVDGRAGLLARVGESARTLSRGEALRIELARTALAQPDLVVIDSPALDGDPDRAALLRQLRRRCPATLVIVTRAPQDLEPDAIADLALPVPGCDDRDG